MNENEKQFECLYDEHVSCFDILRCTKCGTVIFENYDEDYEINLKCPICTNYKTHFTYFTKEDIQANEEKQQLIDFYIQMGKDFDKWEKEHPLKM